MNRLKNYCSCLALFFCLFSVGCKKEAKIAPANADMRTEAETLLTKARIWYDSRARTTESSKPDEFNLSHYTPEWDRYLISSNPEGVRVISIPLSLTDRRSLPAYGPYAKMIVFVSQDGAVLGEIKQYNYHQYK